MSDLGGFSIVLASQTIKMFLLGEAAAKQKLSEENQAVTGRE